MKLAELGGGAAGIPPLLGGGAVGIPPLLDGGATITGEETMGGSGIEDEAGTDPEVEDGFIGAR